MHQIIGIFMIAIVFIVLFLMSTKAVGFKSAITAFLAALFLAGWLFLGVHLANAAEQDGFVLNIKKGTDFLREIKGIESDPRQDWSASFVWPGIVRWNHKKGVFEYYDGEKEKWEIVPILLVKPYNRKD